MTEKLRQAIEQTVAILGPEAPLCSGCVDEWTEALRILNDALAEQSAEQGKEPKNAE
jgi:phosphoribosylamine-glycine ligase